MRVEAAKPYDVRFGGPLGIRDGRAHSMSAAIFGPVDSIRGLRPIALCIQDPHVRSWLALGPDTGVHPAPGIHRVDFTDDSPNACGANQPGAATVSGNWGWVDFNGGSNATQELAGWLRDGWDEPVALGDCDADGVPDDGCEGNPGSRGDSIARALNTLIGKTFLVLLYDRATGTGDNARYRVYGALGVTLHGFSQYRKEQPEKWYFDFEFKRVVVSGRCCGSIDTGVSSVRICSVDHDPVALEDRCEA